MPGFAYFNRPVAKLFLGDVGSLPVGLVLGWLLLLLAGSGHLAAALVLPFYYLADATITLVRRLAAASRSGRRTVRTFTRSLLPAASPSRRCVAGVFGQCLPRRPGHRDGSFWGGERAGRWRGGAFVAWLLSTFARGRI